MTSEDSTGPSLRAIDTRLLVAATKWWGITIACRFGVFVLSVITVLIPDTALVTALAAGIVLLLSELCLWRSNKYNEAGQTLHRQLEMRDSFNWEISQLDRKEFASRVPKKLRDTLPSGTVGEQYFASKEAPGVRKALENLQESAWWSQHLTQAMLGVCIGVGVLLIVSGIAALVLALELVADVAARSTFGQMIILGVTLIFSLELLRLIAGYYQFNQTATATVRDVQSLLRNGNRSLKERDAVKLWHEYQLARITSPLLPQWVYHWKKEDLNTLWNQEYPEQPAVVTG